MNKHLKSAIEKELAGTHFADLAQARASLTEKYRDPQRHAKKQTFMSEELQRKSYLATRLPATYAVVIRVLEEIKKVAKDLTIDSLLDIGSGPGTALWAAHEVFPEIQFFQAIEQDSALVAIGQRLAPPFPIQWKPGNMLTTSFEEHDMILFSYSLGELMPDERLAILERAWQSARKLLIVIEPGTMPGFACIRTGRQQLINLKGNPIAPCPHAFACPMLANDWCHFAERVERSSEHRRLKEGTRGYEDEKFSYIAMSKSPMPLPSARILRHPQKHSGHINLFLCTPEGLKNETISRRDGDLYKQARKLDWGNTLEI